MGLSLMNILGLSSSVHFANKACYWKFFLLHYTQVLYIALGRTPEKTLLPAVLALFHVHIHWQGDVSTEPLHSNGHYFGVIVKKWENGVSDGFSVYCYCTAVIFTTFRRISIIWRQANTPWKYCNPFICMKNIIVVSWKLWNCTVLSYSNELSNINITHECKLCSRPWMSKKSSVSVSILWVLMIFLCGYLKCD
jgi:hypothetical protein